MQSEESSAPLLTLPDGGELDRLDALLADMLAKTQAELERLTAKPHP
jgi:hypothetical protein